MGNSVDATSAKAAPGELTRGVGPWAAMAVIIANMIGTCIFENPRHDLQCRQCQHGAVGLGCRRVAVPYGHVLFGDRGDDAGGGRRLRLPAGRATGRLVGFLYGWMAFTVARAGSQAALAVGLAIFMNVALGGALDRWHLGGRLLRRTLALSGLTLVALASIWTVALINCASVTTGGRMALVLTMAKVALVLGVGVGAFILAAGDWGHFAQSGLAGACEGVASSARGGIAGFELAMLGALWAYDGWQNVAPLAGEIRNPQRNLPRAFVGGTLVVAALYLFVNAYFYALTPLQIANISTSSSVATEVLKRFLGPMAVSMTAVALMISSFGALHASVLANSRIPFAMARDGLFFRALYGSRRAPMFLREPSWRRRPGPACWLFPAPMTH